MTVKHLPRSSDAFLALALEPRIMFDAAVATTAAVVVEATDSTPGATATGNDSSVTVDDTTTTATTDLFSNVSVSNDTGGEDLNDLVITVDNSGANQALIVDGTTITLEAGSGTTTDNNYAYSVEVADGTTTITISIYSSDTGHSAASASTLIDGMRYSVLDTTVDSGTVVVTLKSLSDGGDDSVDLDITSSIDVTNNHNVAPEVSNDGSVIKSQIISISDLGSVSEVTYSADGKYVYAANADGDLAAFEVDDDGVLTKIASYSGITNLSSVTDMAAGNDALYVISSSNIITLTIGEDGGLTYSKTTSLGDTGVDVSISDDGSVLAVSMQYNKPAIYSIDTSGSSGALTLATTLEDVVGNNSSVIISGDYVFSVVSGLGSQSVYMFKLSGSGADMTATQVTSFTLSDWSHEHNESYADVIVSEDGETIYFANKSTDEIFAYSVKDDTITSIDTESLSDVTSIALSEDGTMLYATTSSGALTIYAVADDGSLSLSTTVDNVGGNAVVVSGSTVLTAGSGALIGYSGSLIYTIDGDPVTVAANLTMSDGNLDALADGSGNYNGASIIIGQSVDGSEITTGSFDFADGNDLTLSDGKIYLNGVEIATFSTGSDGALTISFTADTTTAVANQVLQQVTYANNSVAANESVTLNVKVNDGELDSSAQAVTVSINAGPVVDSGVASSYTLDTVTTETAYSFVLSRTLFTDADGENLIWTVSGLPDGLTFDAETLTISGTTSQIGDFSITVKVTDISGASATTKLTLTVEQIANRAPEVNADAADTLDSVVKGDSYSVTLDSDMFSDADSTYGDTLTWTVSGLPDGLSFDAETLTISGTVTGDVADYTVTVTATDGSGAATTHNVTLRVITQAESDNSSPIISGDTDAIYYTSDGDLSGYDYYVADLALSDDGETLIVVGSTDRNGNGTSYLSVYSRDTTTGELTLQQTFTQGTTDDGNASNGIEIDGLSGITSVSFSGDGSYLYIAGYASDGSSSAYTISVFSVGSDGNITHVGQLADIGEKVLEVSISGDGDTLYALSATTVYAYTIDDSNHTLTLLDTESDGDFNAAVAMEIGKDGTVYVLSSSRLTIYEASEDGSLTYAGQMTRSGTSLTYTASDGTTSDAGTLSDSRGFKGSTEFVVSDDGYIYVVTGSNFHLTTLHYNSTTNTVDLVNSVSTYSALGYYSHNLAISDDGTTLYVVGAANSKMVIYSIGSDGTPTLSNVINSGDGGSEIVVSSDGKSIYIGQDIFYAKGLRQLSAEGVASSYTEGATTQIASNLTLSDTEYDALSDGDGNYNGATISIVREGGADSNDSFGFADDSDLALDGNTITLNGETIATFTSSDGKVTITFTADVTTAVANKVLQQVTYTNASDAPSSTITLVVSVQDEYASGISSTNLILSVTSLNDAPTATATGTTATYTEGDENAVDLFNDVSISTIEDGQGINSFTLTITGVQDGANETLTIHDTEISLGESSSGNTSDWNYEYTVTVAEDGTVTLTFKTTTYDSNLNEVGSSTDTVASLIDGITYANTGDSVTSGTRTITLSAIEDDGGTSNNGVDTATLSIAATVVAVNDAPTVSATPTNSTYTEGISNPVNLFSDTTISTIEDGQTVSSFTLTVSNVSDGASEILTIDGTAISLEAGSGTTTNGYTYEVTVSDGTATVKVSSSSGIAADTAGSIVDGITYQNTSSDVTLGDRTVTLSAVQDSGGTDNNGDDTAELSIAATISVVEVNDAPEVSATGTDTTYTEGGSAAGLFSGTTISTVEDGQTISSFTLTVSGVNDGASEVLTIDGTAISLVAGSGTTTNGYSYEVSVSDGTVTVKVSSTTGIAADTTASLINGITYADNGDGVTAGDRTVALTAMQDDGGTDYGGDDTAELDIAATVSVVAINDAPTLGANAVGGTYMASGDASRLFDGASISAIESNQGIASLTITAEGIVDNHEVLIIDGASISLVDGTSVTTANGLSVSVSLSNGTGTITVTSAGGLASATAQDLVDNIAYANSSDTVSFANRTFTLASVQDNGGTENNGEDTTTVSIVATVTVVNSTPEVTSVSGILPEATPSADYSASLAGLLHDADGENLTWSVEGLPDGLSFDAETLTVSGSIDEIGTYSFIITVTDGAGEVASRTVSLLVRDDPYTVPSFQDDPMVTGETAQPSSSEGLVGTDDASQIYAMAWETQSSFTGSEDASSVSASLSGGSLSFLNSVKDQVTETTTLSEIETIEDTFGSFDFTGSKWIAVVDVKAGQTVIPLKLPDSVKGGSVRLSLENGLPLPNWVRFDPASGNLNIDRQHINEAQHLDIRVQSRATDGSVQETHLEILSQANEGATVSSTEVSSTELTTKAEENLSQLQIEPSLRERSGNVTVDTVPKDLLDEVQDLLINLAGLNPNEVSSSNFSKSLI